MTIDCSICQTTFPNKASKQHHVRNKCTKKSYILKIPDQADVAVHLVEDFFHCQCSGGQCKKTFSTFRSLQDHISKANTPWGSNVRFMCSHFLEILRTYARTLLQSPVPTLVTLKSIFHDSLNTKLPHTIEYFNLSFLLASFVPSVTLFGSCKQLYLLCCFLYLTPTIASFK